MKIYNPYEYVCVDEEVKYEEPLLDWKLTCFAFSIIYLPFIIVIIAQVIGQYLSQ